MEIKQNLIDLRNKLNNQVASPLLRINNNFEMIVLIIIFVALIICFFGWLSNTWLFRLFF